MKKITLQIEDDIFEKLRELAAMTIMTGSMEARLDSQFVFLIIQAIRTGQEELRFPPVPPPTK